MPGLTRSRLMRLPEVIQLTGVSRSTIYRWMANGEFPKQISLGANTVAWLETDVGDWYIVGLAPGDLVYLMLWLVWTYEHLLI